METDCVPCIKKLLMLYFSKSIVNGWDRVDFGRIRAVADTSAKDAHLTADLECHLGLVPHQVRSSLLLHQLMLRLCGKIVWGRAATNRFPINSVCVLFTCNKLKAHLCSTLLESRIKIIATTKSMCE